MHSIDESNIIGIFKLCGTPLCRGASLPFEEWEECANV
jgi:hypothetical protein